MNTPAEALLHWYDENRRDLPWRHTADPYRIWLSEIMLQQTRVESVKGYYARFLEACPTVDALAAAPIEQVLKLWRGWVITAAPGTCTGRRSSSWTSTAGRSPRLTKKS